MTTRDYTLQSTISLGKHDLGILVDVVKKSVNRQCSVLDKTSPVFVNQEFETSQQEQSFSSVDEIKSKYVGNAILDTSSYLPVSAQLGLDFLKSNMERDAKSSLLMNHIFYRYKMELGPIKLSSEFSRAISSLPTNKDDPLFQDLYNNFIHIYGTHLVKMSRTGLALSIATTSNKSNDHQVLSLKAKAKLNMLVAGNTQGTNITNQVSDIYTTHIELRGGNTEEQDFFLNNWTSQNCNTWLDSAKNNSHLLCQLTCELMEIERLLPFNDPRVKLLKEARERYQYTQHPITSLDICRITKLEDLVVWAPPDYVVIGRTMKPKAKWHSSWGLDGGEFKFSASLKKDFGGEYAFLCYQRLFNVPSITVILIITDNIHRFIGSDKICVERNKNDSPITHIAVYVPAIDGVLESGWKKVQTSQRNGAFNFGYKGYNERFIVYK